MKFLHKPNSSRMHSEDARKKSAYAFVPHQTNFGELCGFADDVVYCGEGFGMHPHQNMEISTIIVSGTQMHKDNFGNAGSIDVNCVQTMSAGVGIVHSELNASKTESFHSYQIWVYPKKMDVKPRYEKFLFDTEDKKNKILLALSPDKRNNTALINQDAFFSICDLSNGSTIDYTMNMNGNGVYIHCAKGTVTIENFTLNEGDALGVYETDNITLTSSKDTELILVEVPMKRGIKI